MSKEEEKKHKKPRYMRWYPERWLDGSLRDEFTASQRGVWADLLCLGARNDPPGQIDFTSVKSLARRLRISTKLLYGTLKNASLNKKIRFIKIWVDSLSGRKFEENELKLSEIDISVSRKSKIGIPLNAIVFIDWDQRQPPYYWQRPYPKKDGQNNKTRESLGPESCVMDTERTLHDTKTQGKERSGFPSNPRDQFIYILKEFSEEYPYPFDKEREGQIFDLCINRYRSVDPITQLKRKIEWWKKNQGALHSRGKGPREQLIKFIEQEARYQSCGENKKARTEEEPL
jgi:hypothetical protein